MDNARLVGHLYAAFERGDIAYIVNQLADDVEWVVFGPSSVPFTGAYYGRDAVRRFFSVIHATQNNPRVAVTEIVASGKTVVASVRYSGQVSATGGAFDTSAVHIFTCRGGRIASLRDYFDTAQLAAAYAAPARSAAA